MTEKDCRGYLQQKLIAKRIYLFEVGFSDFLMPMVFLQLNKQALKMFPDYYQDFVKAHVMETGYLPFASPYENQDFNYLETRWNEWFESLEAIKRSILNALRKLPENEHMEALPEGFI